MSMNLLEKCLIALNINRPYRFVKLHIDTIISICFMVTYLFVNELQFKDKNNMLSFISFEATVLALLVSVFLAAFTIIDTNKRGTAVEAIQKLRNLIDKIYKSIKNEVLPSSFCCISLSIVEYYLISVDLFNINSCLAKIITAILIYYISYSLFSIYFLARDSINLSYANFETQK